jgi:hypothetical protein
VDQPSSGLALALEARKPRGEPTAKLLCLCKCYGRWLSIYQWVWGRGNVCETYGALLRPDFPKFDVD